MGRAAKRAKRRKLVDNIEIRGAYTSYKTYLRSDNNALEIVYMNERISKGETASSIIKELICAAANSSEKEKNILVKQKETRSKVFLA